MSRSRGVDPAGLGFGIALPPALAVAGLLLTEHWKPRLPVRIGTHFSGGHGTSLAAPMSAAWTFALVIVLVGGGICAISALAQALLLMRRAMLVVGLTVTGIVVAVQLSSLAVQLDRRSGADVALPWAAIPGGALAGFLVGALGAALLRDYRTRTAATDRPKANLPRLATSGPIRDIVGFGRAGVAAFVTVTLGALILGCLSAKAGWPIATGLPLIVILAGLLRFDVTADATGVRVRNLGMVSLDIGTEEITGAKVLEVSPFRDYGGWGLRAKGRGRYGIVTRTGPAVRIDAASGITLTITTDRAETMAGAINTWATAVRSPR